MCVCRLGLRFHILSGSGNAGPLITSNGIGTTFSHKGSHASITTPLFSRMSGHAHMAFRRLPLILSLADLYTDALAADRTRPQIDPQIHTRWTFHWNDWSVHYRHLPAP